MSLNRFEDLDKLHSKSAEIYTVDQIDFFEGLRLFLGESGNVIGEYYKLTPVQVVKNQIEVMENFLLYMKSAVVKREKELRNDE